MQGCWDQIKSTDIKLTDAMVASLQDLRPVTAASKKAKEAQKIDDGIATQIAVINIPGSEWGLLRTWAIKHMLLSPKQSELLRVASQIPLKLPTEKQCAEIWQIHQKLLDEGYIK